MGGLRNGQNEVQIDYRRKGGDLNWTRMKRHFDSLLSEVRFLCHLCVKWNGFGLFCLRNCNFFFRQYVQKETRPWRFIQQPLLQPSPKSPFYISLEEWASDQCSCQTRAASLYLQTAVQSNLFSFKGTAVCHQEFKSKFFGLTQHFWCRYSWLPEDESLWRLWSTTAPPWIWPFWFWFRDYNWMDCHDIWSRLSRPPQEES